MAVNVPELRLVPPRDDWGPRRSGQLPGDEPPVRHYDRDLKPREVGIRGPFLFALAVHFMAAVPFALSLRTHLNSPPREAHATSVRLVSLAAPRSARVTREKPVLPKNPPKVSDVRPKPVPKPDKGAIKIVPDRPTAAEKKPAKREPDRPKVGSADTTQVVRSELPAVGNMRGAMGMWVEGEALPYSYYFEVLQRKIAGYWEPPGELARDAHEVAAVVWFRIERDGRVSSRYVEEPSGSNFFDTSALRALDQALPFPPLPAEYPGDHLIIHLRFVYSP